MTLFECKKIQFDKLKLENENNNNNNDNDSSVDSTTTTLTLHELPQLTELESPRTLINEDGLLKIVSAFGRGLTNLNLYSSPNITDIGLQCIAENCRLLKELDIRKCKNTSEAGIQNLKSKIPNCKVLS